MRRNLVLGGLGGQEANRSVSSVACLAFVALLAIAFWAGAVWLGELALRLSQTGFWR